MSDIALGTRYQRANAPGKVFRVLRIDPTHQPYSITLMSDCQNHTFVTIGPDRLLDPTQWAPVRSTA